MKIKLLYKNNFNLIIGLSLLIFSSLFFINATYTAPSSISGTCYSCGSFQGCDEGQQIPAPFGYDSCEYRTGYPPGCIMGNWIECSN